MGYGLTQDRSFSNETETLTFTNNYVGSGGFNRAYTNIGASIFKGFSLGTTVSLVFGTINQKRDVLFSHPETLNRRDEYSYTVIDYMCEFGAQYQTGFFGKTITFGATYFPQSNLNSTNKGYTYTYDVLNGFENPRDTVDVFSRASGGLTLPKSYSVGLALEEKEQWFLSGELCHKEWSQMSLFNGETPNLKDAVQLKVGAWWVPNHKDVHNYLNIIQYRLGLSYNTGELSVSTFATNSEPRDITDISLSFGLGLPMRRTKTITNLAVQIGKRGTTDQGLVEENYVNVQIAFTFNDKWFKKRKIE